MAMLQVHPCLDFKLKETGILPPYSNTGGPSPKITLRPDYLTLSIPKLYPRFRGERIARSLFIAFMDHFRSGTKLRKGNGRNGFKAAFYVDSPTGKEMASCHFGGQRGRVFIELKGGICKLLDAFQWEKIHVLAFRYKARINRFDLAMDDWEGLYFIQPKIRLAHQKNSRIFLPAGSRSAYEMPVGTHDTPKGFTLEFGTKTSIHFHVIYQKFRESEGTDLALKNPKWMRWEVRFQRQSKTDFSLDMIDPNNWADAFLGSCAYLQKLFAREGKRFVHRVEKIRESVFDSFVAAHIAFQHQWGEHMAICRQIGLEMPVKAVSRDSPYRDFSYLELPEIRERLARVGAAPVCGAPARALRDDSDLLF